MLNLAAAVAEGCVYACGGLGETGPVGAAERYDPESNAWDVLPPMTPRSGVAAAGFESRITGLGKVQFARVYVMGGLGAGGKEALNLVEKFDVMSGTWQPAPALPGARAGLAAVAL